MDCLSTITEGSPTMMSCLLPPPPPCICQPPATGGASAVLLFLSRISRPFLLQGCHRRRAGAPGRLLPKPQVAPPVGVHASHGSLPQGAQQTGARHLALLRRAVSLAPAQSAAAGRVCASVPEVDWFWRGPLANGFCARGTDLNFFLCVWSELCDRLCKPGLPV